MEQLEVMVDLPQLIKGMSFNFLLFFFLAFLFNQVRYQISNLGPVTRDCLTGLFFALIACFGMAMGVEIQPGFKVDGRIVIVGLASAYCGPVSGLVAAVAVGIFRIYLGGSGVLVGLAGIVGGCIVGIFFYRKVFQEVRPYNWYTLIFLGLILTLQAQLWIPLFFPLDIALGVIKNVFWVGILFYPFATLLIGTLINNRIKRKKLHSELMDSYQKIEETVKIRTSELEQANRELKKNYQDKLKIEKDLRKALNEVKQLSGLLPICAVCKNIKDDSGYWSRIERYLEEHTDAEFTHGYCPNCIKELDPDLYEEMKKEDPDQYN